MVPQPLGNGTERGYYIFFDTKQWTRERVSALPRHVGSGLMSLQRDFTLVYEDLETPQNSARGALA
jgi:CCR4-NOT transcription complex subunit 2